MAHLFSRSTRRIRTRSSRTGADEQLAISSAHTVEHEHEHEKDSHVNPTRQNMPAGSMLPSQAAVGSETVASPAQLSHLVRQLPLYVGMSRHGR